MTSFKYHLDDVRMESEYGEEDLFLNFSFLLKYNNGYRNR